METTHIKILEFVEYSQKKEESITSQFTSQDGSIYTTTLRFSKNCIEAAIKLQRTNEPPINGDGDNFHKDDFVFNIPLIDKKISDLYVTKCLSKCHCTMCNNLAIEKYYKGFIYDSGNLSTNDYMKSRKIVKDVVSRMKSGEYQFFENIVSIKPTETSWDSDWVNTEYKKIETNPSTLTEQELVIEGLKRQIYENIIEIILYEI